MMVHAFLVCAIIRAILPAVWHDPGMIARVALDAAMPPSLVGQLQLHGV